MEDCRKGRPHAVVVPFPAQGHINPMMHLAKNLASHGFLLTFITTHHTHSRILRAINNMPSSLHTVNDIELRSIPDGLPEHDPRTDLSKLAHSAENTMPHFLHKLIQQMNNNQDLPSITCIIADFFAGWALKVAEELSIPAASFWPAQIASFAFVYHTPLLLSNGILPCNGVPEEETMKKYLPCMPSPCLANLPWLTGSLAEQEIRFQFWVRNIHRLRKVKWILCNSFHHLELPIIDTFPEQAGICPVGPLMACDDILNNNTLNFWREDIGCLEWLDKKPPNSVIYVSFGSIAVLKEKQMEELALALEATQHPFLWVVRSDLMNEKEGFLFPENFMERIVGSQQGCIVSWSPQISVLSHPSVACFITHCGWNSTLESITAGVPMICWPYNSDQFLNCAYIVQVWKIGLSLNPNERGGVVNVQEIQKSVQTMMNGEQGREMKKRVAKLKECAMNAVKAGGSSYIAFSEFLNFMTLQH